MSSHNKSIFCRQHEIFLRICWKASYAPFSTFTRASSIEKPHFLRLSYDLPTPVHNLFSDFHTGQGYSWSMWKTIVWLCSVAAYSWLWLNNQETLQFLCVMYADNYILHSSIIWFTRLLLGMFYGPSYYHIFLMVSKTN